MNLEVSVGVYSGLQHAATTSSVHRHVIALRCIEVAYKLGAALKAGYEVYHLNELIPIKLPTPDGPPMHTLQIPYNLEIYRGLNEVCSYFKIKPSGVVAWGLDRMPDIEERLLFDDIFIIQPSGPIPLTLSWLNQNQSQ